MLIKESQDKENKMVDKTSSDNSQNDLLEGHGRETSSSSVSLDGQDEDTVHQRLRTKAFSVGKRTTDPEMLAKRGSALMNAFIDNSVKAEDSEGSFHGSPGRKPLNDVHNTPDKISIDGKKIGKNEQTTEVMSSNTPRIPSHLGINTNTGKIEKSNLESKKEMSHNGDDTPSTRGKADISGNSSSMGSGEELGSVLSEGTSRRKRSANYDVDKRRLFENRVERDVKHVTHDRVLAYGIRSRRQRVSVKDQVKQLEQRENDSIRTPPVTTGLHNNAVTSNHLTEKSFLSNVHTVSNVGKIDWKNNSRVERKGEGFPGKATVRVHEPLSRVCVTGGHIEPLGTSETLTIKPPRSPVAHRQPEDEATKFCALKMDISLESSQTPSSNSSEEDHNNSGKEASENVERGRCLATWPGRSLTPRDSNQEPEFV